MISNRPPSQSIQAAPEQILRGTIGSTHAVLPSVEIDPEESPELAAGTADAFAGFAADDVHSVLVTQVHHQLRHFRVEVSAAFSSTPWRSSSTHACGS